MQYSKKDLISALREQLSKSDSKAIKGLLTIYEYQTLEEQKTDYVCEDNGVGFTGCDSEFLSSLSKRYIQYNYLSDKQIEYLRKLMPKYARQLIQHSINKGMIEKVGRKYQIVK